MATVAENQAQIESLNVDISSIQNQITTLQNSSAYQDCEVNDFYNLGQNATYDQVIAHENNTEIKLKQSTCGNIGVRLNDLNYSLKAKQTQLQNLLSISNTNANSATLANQQALANTLNKPNIVIYVIIGIVVLVIIIALIKKRI